MFHKAAVFLDRLALRGNGPGWTYSADSALAFTGDDWPLLRSCFDADTSMLAPVDATSLPHGACHRSLRNGSAASTLASRQLEKLHNRRLGITTSSANVTRLALLMDNIEV